MSHAQSRGDGDSVYDDPNVRSRDEWDDLMDKLKWEGNPVLKLKASYKYAASRACLLLGPRRACCVEVPGTPQRRLCAGTCAHAVRLTSWCCTSGESHLA